MTPSVPSLEERIAHLLHQVGEFSKCRGCGADIYWVIHRNGKKTPYTPAGLNHFIDCPVAQQFKKAAQ